MRFLRLILGVLLLAWVVMNGIPFLVMMAQKLGRLPEIPAEMARMLPLFEVTPWWAAGLWAAYLLLMLMAVWRLFRGGKAFAPYALAVAVNVALWWVMSRQPVYSQVFRPSELQADYYILAGELVFGLVIWLTERRRRGLSRPDL
jgi:hypothetical protein